MLEGQFSRNTPELVDAFLKRQQNPTDDNFWAFEEMLDLVQNNPAECWAAILMLLTQAPSLRALSHFAAFPLEDLLTYHGEKFLDIVSREAETNITLRYALAGVWLDGDDSFYNELRRLESKYSFDEIDTLTGQPWSEQNSRPE